MIENLVRLIAIVISRGHLLRPCSRVHLRGHGCHMPSLAAYLGNAKIVLWIILVAEKSIGRSAFFC